MEMHIASGQDASVGTSFPARSSKNCTVNRHHTKRSRWPPVQVVHRAAAMAARFARVYYVNVLAGSDTSPRGDLESEVGLSEVKEMYT